MIADVRTRLVKVLGLLGSDHDGEVVNAGRMAHRLVHDQNLTWEEVVAPVRDRFALDDIRYSRYKPAPVFDWRAVARQVLASGAATAWEAGFCQNLLSCWCGTLTDRQEQTLKRIYATRCRSAA